MSSLRSIAATLTYRAVGALPIRVPEAWAPVFLIGCGRSGTTFMVSVLNDHPEILALNEPRHIWRAVDPRTDVWRADAVAWGAKVVFDRRDADSHTATRCRRALFARLVASRRSVLVEKLPLNSFRLEWLDSMFPQGRFLNLVRNGVDVAASIEQRGVTWYGRSDWKWTALREMACDARYPNELLSSDGDYFTRGLIEWTLSVDRNRAFLESINPARSLTVRYEDWMAQPDQVLQQVLQFLQVRSDTTWIQRNSIKADAPPKALVSQREGRTWPPRMQELFELYHYTLP